MFTPFVNTLVIDAGECSLTESNMFFFFLFYSLYSLGDGLVYPVQSQHALMPNVPYRDENCHDSVIQIEPNDDSVLKESNVHNGQIQHQQIV
jgi:hypothetical protein